MPEPTKPGEPAAGESTTWGAPAPADAPKKSWSGRKTAVAAGVAVVIAAGGGAAIWAGTAANGAEQGQGGPGGGRILTGPGGAFPRDALHGDFVVSDGNGGYRTERLQTGEITEISATSVSLTSKDGYKQGYTIDSSTRKTGDLKTGETVTVTAKVAGDTATVAIIGKGGQPQRGQKGGQPRQGGPSGQDGQGWPRLGY
ncbi:hypothetical protein [Amycolatopsis sp. NPDC051071]|uniref:hypothetical protein n=1 Tax=Amycolatopsis sp. NPDC051071 TaxID=3154637 RepID=UPI00341F4399